MKDIQNLVSQGDTTIRRVDKIPEGFVAAKPAKEVIIAHSETGHHHVAVAPAPLVVFQNLKDPMRMFVKASSAVNVKHLRDWDTHEELKLLDRGGENIWEIIRQREEAPEGWRQVQD